MVLKGLNVFFFHEDTEKQYFGSQLLIRATTLGAIMNCLPTLNLLPVSPMEFSLSHTSTAPR